ncbi:MAG: diaminopimelate epimerase [Candidatus Methanomethylicota archaeon]|uniref:Diaminopimelate epimerase n=1 Tax=Thermoproteota archaeon TaxID=2056631 RepID=A0A497F767_9CREN|nr:MAG: diaminopimelate epimerase [Candidatus Verstraetearchaeota archaeon]
MGRLLRKFCDLKDFINAKFEEEEDLIGKRLTFPLIGEVEISIVKAGEPHAVIFVEDIDKEDIEKYAKAIAMNKKLFPRGISFNLVQAISEDIIKVRTYERGVWGETLACGTGSTASAAVAYILGRVKNNRIRVKVKGGELTIVVGENTLYMIGPAQKVFVGRIELEF